MLSECLRNNMPVDIFQHWLFVDTLELFRAAGAEMTNGCVKLQCLRHCANSRSNLAAHRALDDCIALRDVTTWLAECFGMPVEDLLTRFAHSVNVEETELNMNSAL